MRKILLFVLMVGILASLVSAGSGFEINLKPHYYLFEEEIFPGNSSLGDFEYNRLSFDVIGKNQNIAARVVDLEIINVSEELFGKFPEEKKVLISAQEKILWQSLKIDTTEIEEESVLFWVGVVGRNEVLNQVFYVEAQKDIKINNPLNNSAEKPVSEYNDWLMKIGNWIWEGDWKKGLFIGAVLVVILIGVVWRYKLMDKLERWRNKR